MKSNLPNVMLSVDKAVIRKLAKVLFIAMSLAAIPFSVGSILMGSLGSEGSLGPGYENIQVIVLFFPVIVLLIFAGCSLADVRGLLLWVLGLFATFLMLMGLVVLTMNRVVFWLNIAYVALWWYLVSPRLWSRSLWRRITSGAYLTAEASVKPARKNTPPVMQKRPSSPNRATANARRA